MAVNSFNPTLLNPNGMYGNWTGSGWEFSNNPSSFSSVTDIAWDPTQNKYVGNYAIAQQNPQNNGFNFDSGTLLNWLGAGANLFNMFQGWSYQNDMLDIAKDQLGIAKEQWQTTKDEMERIRQVRNNLTDSYGGTLATAGTHPDGVPVPGANT